MTLVRVYCTAGVARLGGRDDGCRWAGYRKLNTASGRTVTAAPCTHCGARVARPGFPPPPADALELAGDVTPAGDALELAAAEWLVLRSATDNTPATRAVRRALAAAYLRRQGDTPTARRVMRADLELEV